MIVRLHINNDRQVEDAVNTTLVKFDRIDVLVNNAGYGLLGCFEEMSEDNIRRQFETILFGTMRITRAVLPVMREQGNGINANPITNTVTLLKSE